MFDTYLYERVVNDIQTGIWCTNTQYKYRLLGKGCLIKAT